jgi:hypothetical protein
VLVSEPSKTINSITVSTPRIVAPGARPSIPRNTGAAAQSTLVVGWFTTGWCTDISVHSNHSSS